MKGDEDCPVCHGTGYRNTAAKAGSPMLLVRSDICTWERSRVDPLLERLPHIQEYDRKKLLRNEQHNKTD